MEETKQYPPIKLYQEPTDEELRKRQREKEAMMLKVMEQEADRHNRPGYTGAIRR